MKRFSKTEEKKRKKTISSKKTLISSRIIFEGVCICVTVKWLTIYRIQRIF